MAQPASPTKHMLLRLPPELHEAIKDQAAREDRTIAQTVRQALRKYLEEAPKAS